MVNALNELFTVGAFESVVVADPHATLIADVGGASSAWLRVGSNSIDPDGADVGGRDGGGINSGGVRSTVLIDQPGEYFSFDLRRKDTYGLGLIDVNETSGIGAEDKFRDGTGNYAEGFKWSQWLHSSHGYAWTMWPVPTPGSLTVRHGWEATTTSSTPTRSTPPCGGRERQVPCRHRREQLYPLRLLRRE